LRVSFKDLTISTSVRIELIDLTIRVEEFVQESGIDTGLCLVSSPHTTTAVIVNEHEDGLVKDIVRKLEQEFPRGAGWLHDRIDDNANSHLASTFLGSSKTLPIRGGRLIRGTWQSVFFVELDGPRSRSVLFEAVGP
jgi:secondary thiamine-phosphate synthase enzyme